MANLLTGDFEAVLQVSADTLNRLLASMHQNAWGNPDNPSFPHSTGLRLGDYIVVDGVQGTAWAQVGVPRMTLIDRATDRFLLEVGLRIRYLPDEGTEPLPSYSRGTLRATYVLDDIDPTCIGWSKLASHYLWVRVDPDSVSFEVEASGEDDWLSVIAINPSDFNVAFTNQLRALLEFQYEPSPHPVERGFRRGSFLCLDQGFGQIDEVPILSGVLPAVQLGGSAVSIPIGLTQHPPLAEIGSIGNVLLAQRDFALALNVDAFMGQIDAALDGIRAYTQTFNVSGDFGSAVYNASVSSASAVWLPRGSYAEIAVTVEGGTTHTESVLGFHPSVLPDLSFTVNQRFQVDFDAGAESFRFWSAGNNVTANASGVGLPSGVLHDIATTIGTTVESQAEAAANAAAPSLQQFTGGTAEFVKQLRGLDADADAHLDDATFHLSGVVLRGWVSVARRKKPVVTFRKIDDDTFSALDAWIPGGRVDRLKWEWTWSPSFVGTAGDEGDVAYDERYVLKRQPSVDRTPFGAYVGPSPLPGLDGPGRVCLTIEGVVVDPATGQYVPVIRRTKCMSFNYLDRFRADAGRLYLKEWDTARPDGHDHGDGGVRHLDVTYTGRAAPGSANTLVIRAGRADPGAFATTLHDGLAGCGRNDAGLHVLVVLPEGAREAAGPEVEGELRRLGESIGAPMLVNEDVGGGWSRALAVPAANDLPSWRLLSPDGGVLWMKDEQVSSEELTDALDRLLYPSVRGEPTPVDIDLGWRLKSPDWLGHLFDHPPEVGRPNCPPFRGVRASDLVKVAGAVTFVHYGAGSDELVQRLRTDHGHRPADGPGTVVVLDGATPDEARAMGEELGPQFLVVSDEDGSRARAIGVRFWPTTVTLVDSDDIDDVAGSNGKAALA